MLLPFALASALALAQQDPAGRPSGPVVTKIGVFHPLRDETSADFLLPAIANMVVPEYRRATVYIVRDGSTTRIFVEPVNESEIAQYAASWSYQAQYLRATPQAGVETGSWTHRPASALFAFAAEIHRDGVGGTEELAFVAIGASGERRIFHSKLQPDDDAIYGWVLTEPSKRVAPIPYKVAISEKLYLSELEALFLDNARLGDELRIVAPFPLNLGKDIDNEEYQTFRCLGSITTSAPYEQPQMNEIVGATGTVRIRRGLRLDDIPLQILAPRQIRPAWTSWEFVRGYTDIWSKGMSKEEDRNGSPVIYSNGKVDPLHPVSLYHLISDSSGVTYVDGDPLAFPMSGHDGDHVKLFTERISDAEKRMILKRKIKIPFTDRVSVAGMTALTRIAAATH